MTPCVVCTGRFGDVLNALPMAEALAEPAGSIEFVTASEFVSVLEGASYLRAVPWPGDYANLPQAVEFAKSRGLNPVIAQSYGTPAYHNHATDSYQREAWHVAGMLDHFGTRALRLDRRDAGREEELYRLTVPHGGPFVLVASTGVSSPVPKLAGLAVALRAALPGVTVIDLDSVRAHRIYDLLGLYDRAELMVSIDTVHLHLARASRCPVISIINDGWRGSVPPPSTVATFRYSEASPESICAAAVAVLTPKPRKVFHAVNVFGRSQRHKMAQATWDLPGLLPAYSTRMERDARDLGDDKALPYLRDILGVAEARSGEDDVILWTNDDAALDPRIIDWATVQAGRYGAATMRRDERGHCGREVFAFTKRWLRDNPLPDFVIGTHQFDLAVAAMVRHQRGIRSTIRNIGQDFHPADASERYVLHEPHPSKWDEESPAAKHNAALFTDWLAGAGMQFWAC